MTSVPRFARCSAVLLPSPRLPPVTRAIGTVVVLMVFLESCVAADGWPSESLLGARRAIKPLKCLRHFRSSFVKIRQLGNQGLKVTELGLGCMGLSDFYSSSGFGETEGIALIHRALDLGVSFLDTAD